MNCQTVREWLDAFVDSELDLAKSIEMESHINECPQCAAARDSMVAMREQFQSGKFHESPPVDLERSVRLQLRRARSSPGMWRLLVPLIPYFAIAATLAIVLFIWRGKELSTTDFALRELVAAHVRSTQVDHLTDVLSTDQHTVKPWFEGKLDFSPPVRDFAASGFELVGGRLDYLGERAVAAIVYRRQKHIINVFISSQRGDDVPPRIESSQGFNIIRWRKAGMSGSAVSDLNAIELSDLVKLIAAGP